MTKPVDGLLPLPLEPDADRLMKFYHDALHELVCFGTHILAWNLEQGQGNTSERNEIDLAIALLFRHILELVDAISVQVRLGVIVPCKIHLRAILESYLSLEHMVEKDRRRRGTCFLLVDHYRKSNYYKKLIPNTEENKKLADALKSHGFFMSNLMPINEATRAFQNQQKLIAHVHYSEVNKEYLSKTNNNTKNLDLKWYSLFDGPISVAWLAKRLKKFDLYEFFYKQWSNPTHGTDLSTNVLVRGDDGNSAMVQLRNLEEAFAITQETIYFTLMIMATMGTKVVSERRRDYSEWALQYRDEFRIPVENTRQLFK